MSQTSYTINQGVAIQGSLADIGLADCVSKIVQDAGGIRMGLGVVQGADDQSAKLPSGASDFFLGMSVAVQKQIGSTLAQGDAVNVLKRGRGWVVTEAACVAGSPVQVRYSANGLNTVVGAFTPTVDAGHTLNVPNATFVTSAAAGGLAIVDFNSI